MCGRFTLRAPASAVAEAFSLVDVPAWQPRFNIAPSQPVPVVRLSPAAAETPGTGAARQRQLVFLRWGLIPSWADDPAIGNRLINARAETAAEKPAFRAAFRQRRCLLVADGFYEWRRSDRPKATRRQPYLFQMRDGRPMGFAGLWESWEGPDRSRIESCTILTTAASDLVAPVHDRMPVILAPADYARWLDPAASRPEPLLGLLGPYPSREMTAYPVSAAVNSPACDGPQCVEPAEQ
ncbi:MAG: SOS response-associated peptidase [Thermoguttaceae bacterium]|jgi:putative SOS response-associated peptidase YedK